MTRDTYADDRFALVLVGLFGVVGLVLAAIGLYGLLSLQVERRTREIGVRAALGAARKDIVLLVFRDAFGLVAIGLVVGSILAGGATFLLRHQLHDVSPFDPLAYASAAGILAAAAAMACWWPTRRATRVDPMVALRSE
jgi:putative ABC transport system permease protein